VRRAWLLAASTLAACGFGGREAGPAASTTASEDGGLRVTASTGALAAPDSNDAGWTRVRVEEDGAGHVVVVFRLADGATAADVPTFVAALDTAAATPAGAMALGGPEVGDSGTAVLELSPGLHVVACVSRRDPTHRHAGSGEARRLVVRPARGVAPAPAPTDTVPMTDFAFPGADRWRSGRRVLAVRNDGRQDHQLRLARLRDGTTLREWVASEGESGTDVAGMARLGAGRTAYLPVELPPGEYVAYCMVPDARTRQPHVSLGMMRAIHVR
jgi:hypothetical protein